MKHLKNFIALILAIIIFVISIPFWIMGFIFQVLFEAFDGGRNDWKNY